MFAGFSYWADLKYSEEDQPRKFDACVIQTDMNILMSADDEISRLSSSTPVWNEVYVLLPLTLLYLYLASDSLKKTWICAQRIMSLQGAGLGNV